MAAKPIDIRTVPLEEYWKTFEQQWTGLLSYRYIGRIDSELDVDNEGAGTMVLRHDMRNARGGARVAPLIIFSPDSGGMSDHEYVPNPVIQSVQVLDDARDVTRVRSIRENVRVGRQMGFSRSLVVDEDDPNRVISIHEGMAVSLGLPPEGYEPVPNPPIQIEDSPDLPPLTEVFGATKGDDGLWRLPELSAEFASPDAALHLGPQHITIEAAAMDAAATLADADRLQIESYHCMFVARGKVGPFVARSEAFLGQDGKVGTRVQLRDEGNGDRVVTSVAAVFRVDS